MKKIKDLPIIGYVLRVLLAVIKLPKHIDAFYHALKEQSDQISSVEKQLQEINDIKNRLNAIYEWMDKAEKQLGEIEILKQSDRDCLKEIEILKQSDRECLKEIEILKQWNMDRLNEIKKILYRVDDLEGCNVSDDYIKRLNLLSSTTPTIWGKESRLHISEFANVNSCTFNVNSGHIYIDDFTFSGLGVSLLAGSHDMELSGFLRRNYELPEGFDIKIGKGVWLASNCTILGPAVIGDNAVIAAGAVIVPGTVVQPNTVYGGVPAKKIKELEFQDNDAIENQAIQSALKRNGDILFLEGWSERKHYAEADLVYPGYYLIKDEAIILCTKKENKLTLSYIMDDTACYQVRIVVDGMQKEYSFTEKKGSIEIPLNQGVPMHKIVFCHKGGDKSLFFIQESGK